MKKIIYVFLFVLVLCICLSSCNYAKPQVEHDDSEKEIRYNEAFRLIGEGDYISAYNIFNELGDYKDSKQQSSRFLYIPIKRLISCGDIEIIGEITLNEDNLPVQIVDRYGTEKLIFNFSYDKVGNLIQKSVISQSQKTVYDYTYDEKNKLTKEVCTFADGNVNVFYYEHDSRGNLVKEIAKYYSGSISIKEYKYNFYGMLTQKIEESYYDDFIYKGKYDYTYDTNGNLIKELQTHSDGKTSGFDYTYDNHGNLLKRIHTTYSGAKYTYECVYDTDGNLIQEVYTDSYGNKEIYDAVYDAEGNLVEGGYTVQGSDRVVYRTAYYEGGRLIKDVYIDLEIDYAYDSNGNIVRENHSRTQAKDFLVEYEYKFVYTGNDVSQEVEKRVEDFRDNWNSFETWFGENGNG